MELNFKNWLKEVATSTACVASFARPFLVDVHGDKKKEKKDKKKD